MTPSGYAFLQKLLRDRSGLALGDAKQYLVDNRLKPVARKAGFQDIEALVRAVRAGNHALETAIVEAMMTNESFFFRDKIPFDILKDEILPDMRQRRAAQRKLRVWCAAASSGQEPYSIAMILAGMLPSLPNWSIDILGTDISSDVLAKARAGIYSQFEVQRGLPVQLLVEHFDQHGTMWQLKDAIRSMVSYREHNLLRSADALGQFDVVFCRNVLIYFDAATKRDVLRHVSRQIAPDGYLVLGAAETVVGLSDELEPVADMRGVYRHRVIGEPRAAQSLRVANG